MCSGWCWACGAVGWVRRSGLSGGGWPGGSGWVLFEFGVAWMGSGAGLWGVGGFVVGMVGGGWEGAGRFCLRLLLSVEQYARAASRNSW